MSLEGIIIRLVVTYTVMKYSCISWHYSLYNILILFNRLTPKLPL